jgi:hypothetical protein
VDTLHVIWQLQQGTVDERLARLEEACAEGAPELDPTFSSARGSLLGELAQLLKYIQSMPQQPLIYYSNGYRSNAHQMVQEQALQRLSSLQPLLIRKLQQFQPQAVQRIPLFSMLNLLAAKLDSGPWNKQLEEFLQALIQQLLEMGADPSYADSEGNSFLFHCARVCRYELLNGALREQAPWDKYGLRMDVLCRNQQGQTLRQLIESQHPDPTAVLPTAAQLTCLILQELEQLWQEHIRPSLLHFSLVQEAGLAQVTAEIVLDYLDGQETHKPSPQSQPDGGEKEEKQ